MHACLQTDMDVREESLMVQADDIHSVNGFSDIHGSLAAWARCISPLVHILTLLFS